MRKSTARREQSRVFAERVQRMPAESQAGLYLLLLAHAVLTLALQSSWVVLVLRAGRAGRAATRQGDRRLRPALGAAWSPALGFVTGALVLHRLTAPLRLQGLDHRISRSEADHRDRSVRRGASVTVQIRPFRPVEDAAAHCAGEDELTVRWLTGGYGSPEGTTAYFEGLAAAAAAGAGKRSFGVWLSGRLCGYIDYDPDLDDGIGPDDVSLSYAVHPWARGQGVAVAAVRLLVDLLRSEGTGSRAAIRVEPENLRSVRVAVKAGFTHVRDFSSSLDTHPDGTPTTLSLYLRDL